MALLPGKLREVHGLSGNMRIWGWVTGADSCTCKDSTKTCNPENMRPSPHICVQFVQVSLEMLILPANAVFVCPERPPSFHSAHWFLMFGSSRPEIQIMTQMWHVEFSVSAVCASFRTSVHAEMRLVWTETSQGAGPAALQRLKRIQGEKQWPRSGTLEG